jgi:solute:Na+ symporter, SSS family
MISVFNNLNFYVFAAVIGLLLGVGIYKTRHIQLESAYLFAERKTRWGALTATLVMTEFNSATLLSFCSFGYEAGFWALILPAIFLIGLLFYALTVAEKWKRFDGVSVAGFFREKYGNKIGVFASSLLLLSMLGFSAAYIKSLALLFQPLFPQLNLWMISAALVGTILAMMLRGGLTAIIRTDVLSFFMTLLFIPLMIFFVWNVPQKETLPFSLAQGQAILPIPFVVSLTILTMFTYILAPWYGQKIFAAKSGKTAYWAVFSAAILVFFLYGAAIFATALLKQRGIACPSAEQALPQLIHQFFPLGFKGFAFAILFTISATTLTGVWSAMSAMFIGDFLIPQSQVSGRLGYKTKIASRNRPILITTCFAVLSYLLANSLVDRVFNKMILANIPVAALSFGLLAGFYWQTATRLGVYLSILVGCMCGIGSYLLFGESGGYTWYWAVYGIPFSFLAGVMGSYGSLKLRNRCNNDLPSVGDHL